MTIFLSSFLNSKGIGQIERDLTGAVTDEWIVINNDLVDGCLTVGIIMSGAATAKVQFTAQAVETIVNGTPVATDWAQGDVTATTYATFPASTTGIRFDVTSGTIQGIVSI